MIYFSANIARLTCPSFVSAGLELGLEEIVSGMLAATQLFLKLVKFGAFSVTTSSPLTDPPALY
jgi:hypothetical protein